MYHVFFANKVQTPWRSFVAVWWICSPVVHNTYDQWVLKTLKLNTIWTNFINTTSTAFYSCCTGCLYKYYILQLHRINVKYVWCENEIMALQAMLVPMFWKFSFPWVSTPIIQWSTSDTQQTYTNIQTFLLRSSRGIQTGESFNSDTKLRLHFKFLRASICGNGIWTLMYGYLCKILYNRQLMHFRPGTYRTTLIMQLY